MNDQIKKLKWTILFLFSSIKRKLLNRNRGWIMGRVACMGQDVLKLLKVDVPIFNIQKGRVDYLNSVEKNKKSRARSNKVISFIERDDIKYLMFQQQIGYAAKRKPPLMLYMDSFSELTDQIFYHKKQKWSFCANYSDINNSSIFEKKFESKGLLQVDNLIEEYRNFFSSFRKNYGDVPILFLHFPVELDIREKFQLRFINIKTAIDKIKTEFQPFYSFEVDENIVDWPEEIMPGLENFPYHYNKTTYTNLAKQVEQSGILKSIKYN